MKKTLYTGNIKKAIELSSKIITSEGLNVTIKQGTDAVGDDLIIVSGDPEEVETFIDVYKMVNVR